MRDIISIVESASRECVAESMKRHKTDPELRAWLAPSVVKWPVFHGTNAGRLAGDQFRLNDTGLLFFTEDESVASEFAGAYYDPDEPASKEPETHYDSDGVEMWSNGTVYPCYIRLINPYNDTSGNYMDVEEPEFISELKKQGHDGFTGWWDGGQIYCVFSIDQVRFAFSPHR